MDRERSKPWADDTVARIYSMTKPIASVALMSLWERGLFQIDDPVAKVLPEWREQRVWVSGEGEAMQTEPLASPGELPRPAQPHLGLTYGALLETIGAPAARHPGGHGLPGAEGAHGARRGPGRFVAKLGGLAPALPAGAAVAVFAGHPDVIGALVQRLSGKRLDVFLQEEIFGPLGMVDTGFHVRPENVDRFAACYARRADKTTVLQDDPRASPYLQEPVFFSGGGGLVSTMADYHRFCEMLRRGGELDGARIIGPRTLAFMTRNHLTGGQSLAELALDSFSETTPMGVGFGLGFAM